MGRALQPAPAGIPAAFYYERRRPEETTLYQVVQEQLETFLAQVETKTGAGLPEFVKDEFEAFLECGIRRNRYGASRQFSLRPPACSGKLRPKSAEC